MDRVGVNRHGIGCNLLTGGGGEIGQDASARKCRILLRSEAERGSHSDGRFVRCGEHTYGGVGECGECSNTVNKANTANPRLDRLNRLDR